MAESTENIITQKKEAAPSSLVQLSDVFFLTLRHWIWIVISVVVCVGAAYIYLLRIPNSYSRSAELLIKNETSGNRTKSSSDFSDFGLFKSRPNIQNEMSNLKAKDLMEEVVKRLGLDVNYYRPGKFHDDIAYGTNLPVKIKVDGFPDDGSFSMKLFVDNKGKVIIKNLQEAGGESYKQFAGQLNKPIKTPLGRITVATTDAYSKGEDVELLIKKVPLSSARNYYNGNLNVALTDPDGDGTVVRLTIRDLSTQRADAVLNTLIVVYNENWIRDKNQIAVSTSNFINDRLSVIESELGNVDSDISTYKSNNLIPDVDAAASMYMTQSQQNQTHIMDLNNQLSVARYVRSYLSADANHNQLFPSNVGLQSSNVQGLINEYNNKMLQRNALAAKSSETNPIVVQLDEQLNAQRIAIIRTVDNEIVAINTQLNAIRGNEAQTMSRIASNPKQAQNLLSTERQQKVKESLYLYLLQKREENELSQAFTAYNTRVVNKPGPAGATTPNRNKILEIAFLIGLVIPFGVTYLLEISNTKVRGRKDVEHLAVPFVGEIPQYSSDSKEIKKGELIVKSGKRDIINEAFRVLRTNVEFMCNATSDGAKIIAITSFNPGSGKSFISTNLANSIALKGKRVLLIDGDLRHGTSSAYVDSPEVGFSNYLSGGENDIDALIKQNTECENLYILPIGSIPPNPTELLETPRFTQALDHLRAKYDFIIIDCPPIEVVADAQIIDKYVDRTFFIVRAGLLDRSMVPMLDKLYHEKKYTNMGIILNGTSNVQSRYGYGYGYSYRYGYGYGYGYGYSYDAQGVKHRRKKKKK